MLLLLPLRPWSLSGGGEEEGPSPGPDNAAAVAAVPVLMLVLELVLVLVLVLILAGLLLILLPLRPWSLSGDGEEEGELVDGTLPDARPTTTKTKPRSTDGEEGGAGVVNGITRATCVSHT